LQPGVICVLKKEQMQKKHKTAIATKKTVAKHTSKKMRLQKKTVQKKSSIT
jgi:hypothetical protein